MKGSLAHSDVQQQLSNGGIELASTNQFGPVYDDESKLNMNDYVVVQVVACGRCLFRSIGVQSVQKLSSAARLSSGIIRNPQLQALETRLADTIRSEVVFTLEVRCSFPCQIWLNV